MSKTLVGIPTYNGSQRLSWLLRSISLRTKLEDIDVVVVDDGSPRWELTRDVVEKAKVDLPVRFIQHTSNRGIAAAWNTCTRCSEPDANVVLINDDVIVSFGWLDSLTYVLDNSPAVGVVGQSWHAFTSDDVSGLLRDTMSDTEVVPRDPVSKQPVGSRRQQYEDTNPGRVMCPTGQLFAFRRHDYDRIGCFDETYRSFYEESDFGTRMAEHSLIGAQINWPFSWHLWSATFRENPELQSSQRLLDSRAHYRRKFHVPDSFEQGKEFDYTNPKWMGRIPDVPIRFLRRAGPARGILRQDGAFIETKEDGQ